jgi:tetratricopeptide (TPR) repeat protein
VRTSARTLRSTCVAVLVGWTLLAGGARAAQDPREVEGRALYARGDYQPALDVFARLFAEKSDPVYLRNIGRCHQKLRQPERAIDAFQEYLRRAPRLSAAERTEVQGFIREMEALKAAQAAAAPPAPPPHDETAARTPPPFPSPPPAPAAPATDHAAPVATAEASAPEPPLLHRWWFWTAVGVVAAGAVVTAVALGGHDAPALPPCPMGTTCPR